jgi:hypothetical protein
MLLQSKAPGCGALLASYSGDASGLKLPERDIHSIPSPRPSSDSCAASDAAYAIYFFHLQSKGL